MGKIIEAPIKILHPTQITLVREDFKNLFKMYDKGRFSELLPVIARRLDNEEYAVINGTHRIIMSDVSGLDAKLYVPENEKDKMRFQDFPGVPAEHIEDANKAIVKGFSKVLDWLGFAEDQFIMSYNDLKDEYKIHTLDDVRKFVEGSINHPWALTYRGDRY